MRRAPHPSRHGTHLPLSALVFLLLAPGAAGPVIADAPVPASEFVAAGIRFVDDGAGLSPAETNPIKRLMENLPPWHLAGLKKVVYRKKSEALSREELLVGSRLDDRGVLWINVGIGENGVYPGLSSRTSVGVGRSVFRNVLSEEERAAFAAIWHPERPVAEGELNFGGMYAAHIDFDNNYLNRLSDYPVEDWEHQFDITIDAPENLHYILAMDSLFVEPDTGRIRKYTMRGGNLTVWRSTASRTDAWLTIEGVDYRLENGAVTEVVVDFPEARGGKSRLMYRFSVPMPIAAPLLERFRRSDDEDPPATPLAARVASGASR